MIAYLNGTIEGIADTEAVVDVNGVGFSVAVSAITSQRLAQMGMGAPVRLYTYMYVREDIMQLYGFLEKDELALYKMLITVNGIGPKGGLALLSAMSADDLRFAIVSGDAKKISRAQGIGRKTAERLILDLKDKLGAFTFPSASGGITLEDMGAEEDLEPSMERDAADALTSLGYGRMEAVRAVQRAAKEGAEDVESLLKLALTHLI